MIIGSVACLCITNIVQRSNTIVPKNYNNTSLLHRYMYIIGIIPIIVRNNYYYCSIQYIVLY